MSVKIESETTSGVRSRTRRAILDAAIQLMGENPSVTLAEIAEAADVGRTTLHRYFPNRSDLLNELVVDIMEQIDAATERARLDSGTAAEALERLLEEFFDLGDAMTFVFNTPDIAQCENWEDKSESDRKVLRLIERGHADGTIDPELTPQWIAMELIWTTLFGGWDYVRSNRGPRPEARRQVIHTIMKAVAPPAK